MSLINCPDCSREISDKAYACPHCGHPFPENIRNANLFTVQSAPKISGKAVAGALAGAIVIAAGAYFGVVQPLQKNAQMKATYEKAKDLVDSGRYEQAFEILDTIPDYEETPYLIAEASIAQYKEIYAEAEECMENGKFDDAYALLEKIPEYEGTQTLLAEIAEAENRSIYEEAVRHLEKGKYDEAVEILNTIPDYEDAKEVLEEAKYESYAFSAVKELKGILKNPDSLSVYEIHFYEREPSDEDPKASEYPTIVFHYGAQNGFGGNATGYAGFSYDSETDAFALTGTCDSLDSDDLDSDDDDYWYDLLSNMVINGYMTHPEVGQVNMERFNALVKSSSYSAVKIIE